MLTQPDLNVASMRKCQTLFPQAGNTKGGSIAVPLTSCLTGLELAAVRPDYVNSTGYG